MMKKQNIGKKNSKISKTFQQSKFKYKYNK